GALMLPSIKVGVGVVIGIEDVVSNRGSGSVPRTHQRPGLQLFLPMLVPSGLQDWLAVATMFRRNVFSALSSSLVRRLLSVAKAATAEQRLLPEREPSRLWTRPSIAVVGMPPALSIGAGESEEPGPLTVSAAAGRIAGATTSKRSILRAAASPIPEVVPRAV